MKVLQLCYKPPYPPCDGGTLAMNSITQGLLLSGHSVKVLSVCSSKHPAREELMGDNYIAATRFESVFVDLDIHPADAAIALLCGESYNIKRFYSKEFDSKLASLLQNEEFDVIHFESIFMTPYLPTVRKLSNANTVLRAHNVEHLIWRQMALGTRNPLKRWYLKKLALALRAYELEHINLFDGIACITSNDADIFRREGCRKPITDIPFGIDLKPLECVPSPSDDGLSLFHIGAMDWRPNVEGIEWLLHEVWPEIHRQLPHATLHLAGRKMPQHLLQLQMEGVTVHGEVADAAEFINSKQINIVPLLSGSGIRVKIIEAMSLGKTVVTTSAGAAGIKCTDGKDILIADTPEQFVNQVKRCNDDKELLRKIGENARCLVENEYDNKKLTQRLIDFYNKLQKATLQ